MMKTATYKLLQQIIWNMHIGFIYAYNVATSKSYNKPNLTELLNGSWTSDDSADRHTLLCDVHSCLLLIYSWAKSGALSPVKSWLQTDFLLPSCFFNQSEGE